MPNYLLSLLIMLSSLILVSPRAAGGLNSNHNRQTPDQGKSDSIDQMETINSEPACNLSTFLKTAPRLPFYRIFWKQFFQSYDANMKLKTIQAVDQAVLYSPLSGEIEVGRYDHYKVNDLKVPPFPLPFLDLSILTHAFNQLKAHGAKYKIGIGAKLDEQERLYKRDNIQLTMKKSPCSIKFLKQKPSKINANISDYQVEVHFLPQFPHLLIPQDIIIKYTKTAFFFFRTSYIIYLKTFIVDEGQFLDDEKAGKPRVLYHR